ncbi:MAG: HlyD family efflux transporter periplasmic adaptor subunit [Acidobacteria bacterium]|nr:HlyD family efflux transporter periplasmic adaptor subunit [Acidobacteriota bacterium]
MIDSLHRLFREHRMFAVAGIILAGSAGLFGWVHSVKKDPIEPVFQVQRSEFLDVLQFRGELKAARTVSISAPSDIGNVQIVKLAADGSTVKKGEVVVEFDPSKTKVELDQDRSILKSADAQINQGLAEGKLAEEKDTTAVLKARLDLEAAKLDASKGEILSEIEGAQKRLKVKDAERTLQEAEDTLKSDRSKTAATVAAYRSASAKAKFDAERAAHSLERMVVTAPADGTIRLVPIWHDGAETPFKSGDRAWPGSEIAELPDATSLKIVAHVDEAERGRLTLAQPATVQLDAIPDRQFTGKVQRIGTIASTDFSAGWPFPRAFDLQVDIDQSDPRLRAGMNVQVTVIVDRVPNAISIPTQASFMKSGRTVAYVWNGNAFSERAIQVDRRSRDRCLIASGLQPGDRVALKDPSVKDE